MRRRLVETCAGAYFTQSQLRLLGREELEQPDRTQRRLGALGACFVWHELFHIVLVCFTLW